MIRYQEAIAAARALIGTPYSELDCINLIKKIIRIAPGGVKGYTTAGTNSLWKSYTMSKKYKDLTWRQEGLSGARAGMLVFKARGNDVHHVGLVTESGTVVHASSTLGYTAETPLTKAEGWALLAIHRYIETADEASTKAEENTEHETQNGSKQNTDEERERRTITIVDSEQNTFVPIGDFRVLIGSLD